MIRVSELVFEYPGVRALDRVSFGISAGTVTALVGPNGAGKTTLLRCIAALETPFSGRIEVDGLEVEEHPRDVHERLGYLSDFYGLYDDLTVRQCLDHHAAVRGISRERRDVATGRLADRLDIARLLDHRAGSLSRGERQRLAIAQAIVHEPEVLLLDEPASGLDPEARWSLSGLLTEFRDDGITMVVSSHIVAELEDYSTHVLVLRAGGVVAHRPLRETAADRTCIQIELAESHDRIAELLTEHGAIHEVAVQGDSAMIVIDDKPFVRHEVLRYLNSERRSGHRLFRRSLAHAGCIYVGRQRCGRDRTVGVNDRVRQPGISPKPVA